MLPQDSNPRRTCGLQRGASRGRETDYLIASFQALCRVTLLFWGLLFIIIAKRAPNPMLLIKAPEVSPYSNPYGSL